MSTSPSAVCPCCKGTGRVEMSGVIADTLALLRRQGGEVTGAALARLDGCKPTAMNNRLAYLERRGLVTSRRYGRVRLYRAAAEVPS
jgi:DNA-binding transcriptional ArsR family regulator